MSRKRIAALLAASACLIVACGKDESASSDTPLAFAPADTPYLYANLDPLPVATAEQWTKPLQDYWPTMATMYSAMLESAKLGLDEPQRHIATALLDEFRTHANWDQLRAIGLKPDARMAVYAVGIVPVLRLELGNPAAFKAEVARVEKTAGSSMPVAKVGSQEYWQIGNDSLAAAIAVQGSHLVITVLPPKGSDALKRALLGIDRPARSGAAVAALEAVTKQYSYARFGAGYFDFVNLVERVSKPLAGSDAEFAQAVGLPALATDEGCRREYVEIAHKFPRAVIGAQELTAQRMRIATQLEIEPALAQRIASAFGAAPGTGEPAQGAVEMSIAVPILRLKDFWVGQADAVAAKPYTCEKLRWLNEGFAGSKAKVDVTIPPPVSDLTGVRVTISQFAMPAGSTLPDVAGKLLIGSTNPMAALGMAQLAIPALQKIKLAADGKPVALPPDLLPMKTPPMSVAMSDKAIAIATGADQIATLSAFLAAPPAPTPVFLRMHFSGVVYGWLARNFESMKANMPAENQKQFDQQIKLFGLYEKWLRSNDFTLTAAPTGIVMQQTIELNTPTVSQ